MMKTKHQILLWRVEWTHRNGYQAPYQLVWAETRKEVYAFAKTSSRLADFPNAWSFQVSKVAEGTYKNPYAKRRIE